LTATFIISRSTLRTPLPLSGLSARACIIFSICVAFRLMALLSP
jgi:hypothetical protein